MTDQTPQRTTEPVLLPCPFCGGEAWLNDYEAKHSDLPPQSRAPQCRSCGVSPGYLPTAKKAIAAWNTRTTPQPLAIGLDREAVAMSDEAKKPWEPVLVYFKQHGWMTVQWGMAHWCDEEITPENGIWMVDDHKFGPYSVRGYNDGDDTHWMPPPPAPTGER